MWLNSPPPGPVQSASRPRSRRTSRSATKPGSCKGGPAHELGERSRVDVVVVRVVGCLHVTLHGVHSRIHSLRRSSGRRPEAARACSGGAGGGGGLGLGGGLGAAGRPVAGGWWLAAGWWLSLEPWLARSIGAGCLLRYGWMAGCWLPAVGRLHLLALLPAVRQSLD